MTLSSNSDFTAAGFLSKTYVRQKRKLSEKRFALPDPKYFVPASVMSRTSKAIMKYPKVFIFSKIKLKFLRKYNNVISITLLTKRANETSTNFCEIFKNPYLWFQPLDLDDKFIFLV